MRNRRNGLTLMELIVAIFALGTLLSISLPAIQLGRDGGDQIICRDNLRMIGLASAEYDDAFGELPPYMGIPGNLPTSADFAMTFNYQLTYSLTQLLDFVGYSELTEQVDPFAFSSVDATIQSVGYDNHDTWRNGAGAKLPGIASIAFDIQIPEFRCPADSDAPTDSVFAGPHPTNSQFAVTHLFPPADGVEYSITNYVANVGGVWVTDSPWSGGLSGLYGPIRSRRSDSADTIPDGASNVILFGESLGTIDESTNINRRYSMAMGGLACGRASVYPGIDNNFGSLKDSSWVQFGSGHAEVVNFVLADGTVKSINRNIHCFTIMRMCGIADGDPFFSAKD